MVYLKFLDKDENEIEYEFEYLREAMQEAYEIDFIDNNDIMEVITEDSVYSKEDIVRYWKEKQWIHKW